MPFSFLNPWLWFGVIALGAPLWLHLRRKQQKNLVRFSAVRFLDDQPEPRRRPMELRDLALLALRALALLLLVAAFSWPYVKRLNTFPVRESRVYILDNTLSHQAAEGFVMHRNELAAELPKLPADVQAAVVELTAVPRVVAAFGDTRATAVESVRALQPSFQRGAFLAAFRQANLLLENSLGETERIFFLSDNQQNQWNENVSTPPFLRGVSVELAKIPAVALPNLSLSDPRVQRLFLGDKSLVNFTVRLTHSGPAKSANVLIKANGQTVFNREVSLENQPGTILLQGQWETEPDKWLQGEASVEAAPDALTADNQVYFSLRPVIEGRLALLVQSPYLRLALSPEVMRGQWASEVVDPNRPFANTPSSKDAEVLCIESSYLQSSEARRLVTRYLAAGRGVFLIMNRSSPAIDGFVRELGLETEGVMRPGSGNPEKFQFVLSNHPIFHPFASPDYGDLMEVRVSEYVRLKGSEATPLVFGESGEGLFFVSQKFKGKLLVCAFGLDRDHSTWPIHQSFIPFLDLALQAARAEDAFPNTYEPGELATLQFPGSPEPAEVVLREGTREVARYAIAEGRARLRLPDRPGLYSVARGDSQRVEAMLCVNGSPKESELAYRDSPEALNSWRLPSTAGAHPTTSATVDGLRITGVLQQRFWWWMVLAALLLLLFETVWAGAKKEAA